VIEEADIQRINEEADLEAFHEPVGSEPPADAPRTPSGETLDVVEDISPEGLEEVEGIGEPRRGADSDELVAALGVEVDQPITEVPPIDDPAIEVIDQAEIRRGLTYVRVLFDDESSRHLYQVIEPQLTPEQEQALAFIRETLVQTLDPRDPDADTDWRSYLHHAVQCIIARHGVELSAVGQARVSYYLERDLLGYGEIDVMMQDPMIEDVSCDGPAVPVYVFHREHESTRTNVTIEDEEGLDGFVRSLAQRAGRHISIAEPILDATLPDTSRLQATLSREVTTRGSSFTIRRFRADPLTAPDLVRLGTMSARMAAWVWMAMEAGSPTIVAGGTASGKTTTLSAMTQFIPPAKKVVTIEDTREFSLVHENWIASLTRSGSFGKETDREIDMYQLLRTALRQRPEYLIVGEVRGDEAQTLFQAMATGHATYSTMHADSVQSAVHRLENPPIDVPRMMLQTLDAIVVQAQTRVDGQLVRRVLDVTELVGVDDQTGDILTNQVYRWNASDDTFDFQGRSNVLGALRSLRNVSAREIETDWENRARVIEWMAEEGIRHITDVAQVVAAYYANPERLLARIPEVPDAEDLGPAPEDPTEGGPQP
jgi:flagellar protein FlaI